MNIRILTLAAGYMPSNSIAVATYICALQKTPIHTFYSRFKVANELVDNKTNFMSLAQTCYSKSLFARFFKVLCIDLTTNLKYLIVPLASNDTIYLYFLCTPARAGQGARVQKRTETHASQKSSKLDFLASTSTLIFVNLVTTFLYNQHQPILE